MKDPEVGRGGQRRPARRARRTKQSNLSHPRAHFLRLRNGDTVNLFVHLTHAAHQDAVDTQHEFKHRPQAKEETKRTLKPRKKKFTKVCRVVLRNRF